MKKRSELLKKRIDAYFRKEQLLKNDDHKKLEKSFLAKSRKNYTVANLLFNISEQEELKNC